jgi:hypothetical protein
MLADENLNRRNSIGILLEADLLFEVARHDKNRLPQNYPILWRRSLNKFTDFGKFQNCLIRYGQMKIFCEEYTSRSLPHEIKREGQNLLGESYEEAMRLFQN